VIEHDRITSPASSKDIPRIVDQIQGKVGEGPCLDPIREHEVFKTADVGAEERWREFSGVLTRNRRAVASSMTRLMVLSPVQPNASSV